MDSTVLIALITGVCTLLSTVLSKYIDHKSGMAKDVKDIKEDITDRKAVKSRDGVGLDSSAVNSHGFLFPFS